MRNVLILAEHYPPENVSGSRRVAWIVKYLPENGWNPLVVCADYTPERGRDHDVSSIDERIANAVVCRVPRARKRDLSARQQKWQMIRWVMFPLYDSFDWWAGAIRIVPKLAQEYDVAVIWATCEPPAPHAVAAAVHKKLGIPWVADFRDVMGQEAPERKRLHVCIERFMRIRMEIRCIRSASKVITVAEPVADILRTRHGREVICLPNGYDPEMYPCGESSKFRNFSIAYTGKMDYTRNPIPLLEAIELLLDSHLIDPNEVEILLYGVGHDGDDLDRALEIRKHPASSVVRFVPWVSPAEVARAQRESTVLLHLSHPNSKGIMTGKIYEYLGARRPIITIPGDTDGVSALLRRTGAGVSCRTVSEIAAQLRAWYEEWKATRRVRYPGVESEIRKYSGRELAKQLAAVLDAAADERKPPSV